MSHISPRGRKHVLLQEQYPGAFDKLDTIGYIHEINVLKYLKSHPREVTLQTFDEMIKSRGTCEKQHIPGVMLHIVAPNDIYPDFNEKISDSFREVFVESVCRYNAPGGEKIILTGDNLCGDILFTFVDQNIPELVENYKKNPSFKTTPEEYEKYLRAQKLKYPGVRIVNNVPGSL